MTAKAWAGAVAMLVALGGCSDDKHGDKDVTITMKDSASATANADGGATRTTTTSTSTNGDGNATVGVTTDERTGNVKIDAPGFKLDVNVPKDLVNSADFDVGGVKLYPGSKVRTMKVHSGKGTEGVDIGFTAPADPATVRAYLVSRFADKGRALSGRGMTLAGKTEDGKPFTIALSPAAGSGTAGDIHVTGGKSGVTWDSK